MSHDLLRLVLQLHPHAQRRPRATRIGNHVRVYDDPSSSRWKKAAAAELQAQMGRRKPLTGLLSVLVVCGFPCPAKDRRKGSPKPVRWADVRQDADNLAKSLLDAANGVIYEDDRQVVELVVHKVFERQGHDARVRMFVAPAVSPWAPRFSLLPDEVVAALE